MNGANARDGSPAARGKPVEVGPAAQHRPVARTVSPAALKASPAGDTGEEV
jgi:hypothetical protein